jgi:adenylate cyclase
MQREVQPLVAGWRAHGYSIGFGIGLAKGTATVGRIGYEGRVDYTAIGNVVNIAARLCSEARDRQILIDPEAAADVRAIVRLNALGLQSFKGFAESIEVHEVAWEEWLASLLVRRREASI